MSATALATPRFVRRTQLGANEYRRNFHQIDHDVLAAVTSAEADRVTPLMSKIYLRLVSAPTELWEREGVLYFSARWRDGQPVKASKVLYEQLGVASATAHKALAWMHDQGIIGYFAGKNGVGIRIFINRAASSIGVRAAAAGKKILPFARGSNEGPQGSSDEPAFNDSYAVSEVSEKNLNPRAPKSGAGQTVVVKPAPDPTSPASPHSSHDAVAERMETSQATFRVEMPVEEIVSRLRRELELSLQSAAKRAAAQEHERTREWLESRGLPKAARVAQHEAYNVLRKYGVIREPSHSARPRLDLGSRDHVRTEPCSVTPDDIADLAGACVALLETKGQSVELTLSEMSVEGGGFLLPEDAVRVRERVKSLLAADGGRGGGGL